MLFKKKQENTDQYRVAMNGDGQYKIERYHIGAYGYNYWGAFDFCYYNTREEAIAVIQKHIRQHNWTITDIITVDR